MFFILFSLQNALIDYIYLQKLIVECIMNTQDISGIHIGVLMQKHMEFAVLQVLQILHWFVLNLSPFSWIHWL